MEAEGGCTEARVLGRRKGIYFLYPGLVQGIEGIREKEVGWGKTVIEVSDHKNHIIFV